jgi:hypothetical protein
LNDIPAGNVVDVGTVEQLLSECWHQLDIAYDGAMAGYKVQGRTENMKWEPPNLYFPIERHGAIKLGSSRAELQYWCVDIISGSADYSSGIRQKYRLEPYLKTKPLAEKIGKLIIERKNCEELKWNDDKSCVCVRAGKVIPSNVVKRTLDGRRKRFRRDLTEFLKNYGWQEIRPNNYKFIGHSES